MKVKIHSSRHNSENWRWRLVLWLTGGEIEGVPLLPLRPIHLGETVVIKLGQEGSHNTVEIKMPKVTELVPVDNRSLLGPNTFVAFDVTDPERGDILVRIVGTLIGWKGAEVGTRTLFVEDPDTHRIADIEEYAVAQAYWAPMGYRAH